jgi:hypothetical protein
MIPIVVAPQ